MRPDRVSYQSASTQGGYWWIDGMITEGPRGPFKRVYTYGNPPHVSGEINVYKRWKQDRWSHGSILEHDSLNGEAVKRALDANSDIVNDGLHSPEVDKDRLVYQQNLTEVYAPLTAKLVERLRKLDDAGKPYVIACPLNGGEYVAAALIHCARQLDIPYEIPFECFPHFELKRVFNGQLQVGATWGYLPDVEKPYIVVADDCISTNISADATLRFMYERYGYELPKPHVPDRGRKPESLVVVSAASQVGMGQIINTNNAEVWTGGIVVNVGNDKYLYQASEVQKESQATHYYVGDMGRWTMILPRAMNHVAPWNLIREQLREYWSIQEEKQGVTMVRPEYSH